MFHRSVRPKNSTRTFAQLREMTLWYLRSFCTWCHDHDFCHARSKRVIPLIRCIKMHWDKQSLLLYVLILCTGFRFVQVAILAPPEDPRQGGIISIDLEASVSTFDPADTHDSINLPFVIAFIRTPKTGSTSLLNFWMQHALNYNSILSDDYWNAQPGVCQRGIHTCIFLNTHVINNSSNRPAREPQCKHANHGELLETFAKSLSSDLNKKNVTTFIPSLTSLHSFTMVREPLNRLRSLFYYTSKFVNSTNQWAQPIAIHWDTICPNCYRVFSRVAFFTMEKTKMDVTGYAIWIFE